MALSQHTGGICAPDEREKDGFPPRGVAFRDTRPRRNGPHLRPLGGGLLTKGEQHEGPRREQRGHAHIFRARRPAPYAEIISTIF